MKNPVNYLNARHMGVIFTLSVILVTLSVSQTTYAMILPKLDECLVACAPNLGQDENGRVFFKDGLRVNDKIIKITNQLHNSLDQQLNLPVGKPVTFTMKIHSTNPDDVVHCGLGVGIPKGDFVFNDATFQINADRTFDHKIITSYAGDTLAFVNATTKFENADKNVMCTITFTPTKYMPNEMFAISVYDEKREGSMYFVNNGIFFNGESLVDTPIIRAFDRDGHLAKITLSDKTLVDMTTGVDQNGSNWHLVNGFWLKDYVQPDRSCQETAHGYDRFCPEFGQLLTNEQKAAAKYFTNFYNLGSIYKFEFPNYDKNHVLIQNLTKAIDYVKEHPVKNDFIQFIKNQTK